MDTTTAHQLLHPRSWKAARGYSNGMVATGRLIFVAGQIGWNKDQIFESDDLADQTRQSLSNVVSVLAEAGAKPVHITRLTWFITDKKDYLARLAHIGKAYQDVMGRHFPTMTMVQVAALIEDEAKVEIEATAVLPWPAG